LQRHFDGFIGIFEKVSHGGYLKDGIEAKQRASTSDSKLDLKPVFRSVPQSYKCPVPEIRGVLLRSKWAAGKAVRAELAVGGQNTFRKGILTLRAQE
jgi:hypothetical protein